MKATLYKILSLKEGELKLLVLSCGFIFMLFSSYAILRPMRDALGLEGGKDELKWLFLATFVVCILASLCLMWLSGKIKRRFYADCVFVFFALNLIIFYILMNLFEPHTQNFIWLSRVFYVWISVFNLFAFSSAWSLLADVFSKEASNRLFGIIAAGASLGSIAGASSTSILVANLGVANLVFLSIALLLFALLLYALNYLITWFNLSTSSLLTAINKPTFSLILSLSQNLLIPLVLIFALSYFWGLKGIFLTAFVAECFCVVLSIIFIKKSFAYTQS